MASFYYQDQNAVSGLYGQVNFSRDIWNVSYIELRIWNQVRYDHRSYERNLSNIVKVRTSTGYEPVTSRLRCGALTNWAMKPLILRDGHLWVLMSPCRMDAKRYMECFIYWIADLKSSKVWSSQLWTQFKQYISSHPFFTGSLELTNDPHPTSVAT